MKPRIAILASVCLVLIGLFITAGPTSPHRTEALRTADAAASRGGERTPPFDPQSSVVGTSPVLDTTTTVAPTTTTVAPKPTTTVKPKPKVTTPPKPRASSTGDSRRWMPLISQYPWDTEHAYRIMMCESGGNPNAYNPSGATGLFQIHPGGSQYFDPATNVAAAYNKYKASGWAPWVCKG